MNTDSHRFSSVDVAALIAVGAGTGGKVKRFLTALGMTTGKGFEEPVRLYEVRWRDAD